MDMRQSCKEFLAVGATLFVHIVSSFELSMTHNFFILSVVNVFLHLCSFELAQHAFIILGSLSVTVVYDGHLLDPILHCLHFLGQVLAHIYFLWLRVQLNIV